MHLRPTFRTRRTPIALVIGLLAIITIPLGAKASDRGTSFYLSSTTSNIGQARARQLPEGSGLNGGERQLAVGMTNCKTIDACLSVGLDYQYTRYEFTDIDSRDRDLHRLQIPLTWKHASAKRRTIASLAPGIATSSNVMKDLLKRAGADDLYLTGRLEFQPADGQWGPVFGVTYDRAFGQDRLTPVVGFEYRPSVATRIRLAYPDSAIQYQLSGRQHLSWRLFPSGQQWHVVTDDFASQFEYRVEGIRTQLAWQARLAKQITLFFAGGYEFARRHAFLDDAGGVVDTTVNNSWSLSLGIRFGAAPALLPHGYADLQ